MVISFNFKGVIYLKMNKRLLNKVDEAYKGLECTRDLFGKGIPYGIKI